MDINLALQIENVSKQYRLGEIGTGTLSHDLNRWWHKLTGKKDPYATVGEINDRAISSDNPYVWALNDISFEVERGEIFGVIGRNGAGKSTLLKILSKVTAPTTGTIRAKGRIASLLQVGTGFHPELTGRENIYLNGTILGMTKAEVSRKLDEIVDFAGIARYLDTPVKRYSSGMTVRLGFAVAAHLEPEILIIDEVLTVGDAAFQKKAIDKMKQISQNEGRTVLIVSHNMGSVDSLCDRCLVVKNGLVDFIGQTRSAIDYYLASEKQEGDRIIDAVRENHSSFLTKKITLNQSEAIEQVLRSDIRTFDFSIDFQLKERHKITPQIRFLDAIGKPIALFALGKVQADDYSYELQPGNYTLNVNIPIPMLNKGVYYIEVKMFYLDFIHHPVVAMGLSSPIMITSLGISGSIGKIFNANRGGAFILDGQSSLQEHKPKELVID